MATFFNLRQKFEGFLVLGQRNKNLTNQVHAPSKIHCTIDSSLFKSLNFFKNLAKQNFKMIE